MGSHSALIRRRRRAHSGRTALRAASCLHRERRGLSVQAGVGVPSGPLCPQGTVRSGLPQVAPPSGPLLLGTLWPAWLLALLEPFLGGVA